MEDWRLIDPSLVMFLVAAGMSVYIHLRERKRVSFRKGP